MERSDHPEQHFNRHSHEYTRLNDQPDDTIRLLQLVPGLPWETLRARLTLARLNEKPVFQALSYTWGDESMAESIWLLGNGLPTAIDNPSRLPVRRNLWKFLQRLRQDGESGYLWADAICVNQQDIPERSAQVQLMSRIYSSARQVLAWLGNESCAPILSSRVCGLLNTPPCLSAPPLDVDLNELLPILETVVCLKNQRYWTRTWIIQELALARDVILLWGAVGQAGWTAFHVWCESFEDFRREVFERIPEPRKEVFLKWIQTPRDPPCSVRDSAFYMWATKGSSTAGDLPEASSLIGGHSTGGLPIDGILQSLVLEFSDTHCSDPRDKVYALLGLTLHQPFRADYAKPSGVVFWDVVCLNRSDLIFTPDAVAALRLTKWEMKTLVLCLVVTRQIYWKEDHTGRLREWFSRAEDLDVESSYDAELVDWYGCRGSNWDQLLASVAQEEYLTKQLPSNFGKAESAFCENQMELAFLRGAAEWSHKTDVKLCEDSICVW